MTWDQWAEGIRVDMSGKYVMLLIPLEGEKGGQDRVYPVTPDFAELLRLIERGIEFGLLLERFQEACSTPPASSRTLARPPRA